MMSHVAEDICLTSSAASLCISLTPALPPNIIVADFLQFLAVSFPVASTVSSVAATNDCAELGKTNG